MKTIPAFFLCSLTVLIIACGKDKFETRPKLEIKDYNSKNISQGQELRIRINYFDREGDLSEAPIIGILKRLNILPLPPLQDKVDTFRNNLPEFPKKENGEINFTLPFDFLKESTVENDTVRFRFAVTDKAGNTSDTIESAPIVIHLP